MRFLSAAHTDIGTTKKVNQDAFCLKTARTPDANIAFAVLCDGMGGLKLGELASALVVNAYSNWFEQVFPAMVGKNTDLNKVVENWKEIAKDQGRKIMAYGQGKGISLGTTLVVLLIVNSDYAVLHVGDSRLYKISSSVEQLTKDHSLVAMKVAQKELTVDEARVDSRRNVLLQCVGASKTIAPEASIGTVSDGDTFLLCTDGFYHEVSEGEIHGILAPHLLTSEKIMKKSLVDLIELDKSRNEKDNITALLVKAIR